MPPIHFKIEGQSARQSFCPFPCSGAPTPGRGFLFYYPRVPTTLAEAGFFYNGFCFFVSFWFFPNKVRHPKCRESGECAGCIVHMAKHPIPLFCSLASHLYHLNCDIFASAFRTYHRSFSSLYISLSSELVTHNIFHSVFRQIYWNPHIKSCITNRSIQEWS